MAGAPFAVVAVALSGTVASVLGDAANGSKRDRDASRPASGWVFGFLGLSAGSLALWTILASLVPCIP